ncbi:MAG: cupredoxin domain-containing protein [Gemmatimonadaceae bacterium]
MRAPLRLFIVAGPLMTGLLACGKSYNGTAPVTPIVSPAAATVNATPALAFTPASTTIAPAGAVTFAFGSVGHNVFFDVAPGAPADIPGTNTNVSVTRTFTTAGTYTYHCHIHAGMSGTVVVAQTTSGGNNGGGNGGGYNP